MNSAYDDKDYNFVEFPRIINPCNEIFLTDPTASGIDVFRPTSDPAVGRKKVKPVYRSLDDDWDS